MIFCFLLLIGEMLAQNYTLQSNIVHDLAHIFLTFDRTKKRVEENNSPVDETGLFTVSQKR
jgi:hypothetical protein